MLEAKRRAAIFFILAFILAAATGYMVLQKVKDLNSDLGALTKVYVAKEEILSREIIQQNQVTVMELPNKFVIKDSHITSLTDLENRVSVVPLKPGEIITKNMIKPASNLQNENNRLVAIPRTDKIWFDQEFVALDRVDIIVSREVDGKPETSVFMKDVVVRYALKKGEDILGISVEVSADDAPKLIHMENYADHIRLLKSNVGNNSIPTGDGEETTTNEQAQVDKVEETKQEDKSVEKIEASKDSAQDGATSGSGQ
ncbi:MAG: SAF domain-containing protein [Paenisporosarcina sp.]